MRRFLAATRPVLCSNTLSSSTSFSAASRSCSLIPLRRSSLTRRTFCTVAPEIVQDAPRFVPVSGSVNTVTLQENKSLRNFAIIAHVDHGKTTLVDCLLKQSGAISNDNKDRVMDSNSLEQERGITILSKVTSVQYGDIRLNIVDTPGHGDFGGEVERVLTMVDGVVLLVDALEGCMTQTKYVLTKALQRGLRPIVVINKCDRSNPDRINEIETELFDLFASLEATDEQLDYPTVYASARNGWARKVLSDSNDSSMEPLFQTILHHVPGPKVDMGGNFSFLVSNLEYDNFIGRIVTGRVYSGVARIGDKVIAIDDKGALVDEGLVTKVFTRKGLTRIPIEEAIAGDIIGIAGLSKANIGNTVCIEPTQTPIPAVELDPPVMSVILSVNNSPFCGKEGKLVTSSHIKSRLEKEVMTNIAMKVIPIGDKSFEVMGRGELHLGILIETMRREGFEMSISPPKIIFKIDSKGRKFEPQEELTIDVDKEFCNLVIERMNMRNGLLLDLRESAGKSRLTFLCTSRSLIGLKSSLSQETKGTAILNHSFHSYIPYQKGLRKGKKGWMISTAQGKTTSYALLSLEERGTLFITPGTQVYEGMIIGESSKPGDMDVNPCKEKHLTNVRSTSKEDFVRLAPPKLFTLEEAFCAIAEDELIEVTPRNIRMRKSELTQQGRKLLIKKEKNNMANGRYEEEESEEEEAH